MSVYELAYVRASHRDPESIRSLQGPGMELIWMKQNGWKTRGRSRGPGDQKYTFKGARATQFQSLSSFRYAG